jgi:hypothetical protein
MLKSYIQGLIVATFRKRGSYQWEARIRKKGYLTTCKTFETKADDEKWAKYVEASMNKNIFSVRQGSRTVYIYIEE